MRKRDDHLCVEPVIDWRNSASSIDNCILTPEMLTAMSKPTRWHTCRSPLREQPDMGIAYPSGGTSTEAELDEGGSSWLYQRK